MIPIKDSNKFSELLHKSSPGYAVKDGKWRDDFNSRNNDWENLYNEGYKLLDKQRIRFAREVPSQDDDDTNGDWCCGPNSGLRALRLLGETDYVYDSFVECCPKAMSPTQQASAGAAIGAGFGAWLGNLALTALSGPAAPFFTVTQTAIAGATTGAIMAGGIPLRVGPKPGVLSHYLHTCMKDHGATSLAIYSFGGIAELSRIEDEISDGYPVIVLLVSGTFKMHYVTIIGIRTNSFCSNVVILDTDGTIGEMNIIHLMKWMDSDGYANLILDGRRNFIVFGRNSFGFTQFIR